MNGAKFVSRQWQQSLSLFRVDGVIVIVIATVAAGGPGRVGWGPPEQPLAINARNS